MIELRRQGLSSYEISATLAGEGTPLNRTGVAEILTEEGFGRLLRHPQPHASINPATAGRDTRLPRTGTLDWAAWPARVETGKAGLLLLIPDWSDSTCPASCAPPATPAPASCPPCPG